MLLIAHRGNTNGPNPDRENTLSYLQEALDAGYDVEVDAWAVNATYKLVGVDGDTRSGVLWDNKLWLGHDKPSEEVSLSFLRDSRVWVHCKDKETYNYLSKFSDVNCFLISDHPFFGKPGFSQTSRGYIWHHSGCNGLVLEEESIVPWNRMNNTDTPEELPVGVLGIYSDYVGRYRPESKLPFDLLVIDIDGVMTNGKMYGLDGKVTGKSFCDLDFTAIKRFKSVGVKVCFLSGDKTVNQEMAATRKVDFHYNRPGVDKVECLESLEREYGVPRDRMAYVGDDYYDLGIMAHVGLSYCPASSPAAVKRVASVLPVKAGEGVLAALYDGYEDKLPSVYPVDSVEVNP